MSIAKINAILSVKYDTEILLTDEELVMHPSDIILLERFIKEGGLVENYVKKYEPFEIRSKNKVYSHILINTIDYTNTKVLQFETDTDLNTSVQVMGSTKGKKYVYNGVSGYYRRRVILDYASIDSIEYVKFKVDA